MTYDEEDWAFCMPADGSGGTYEAGRIAGAFPGYQNAGIQDAFLARSLAAP